jgi:hypothetical protein
MMASVLIDILTVIECFMDFSFNDIFPTELSQLLLDS